MEQWLIQLTLMMSLGFGGQVLRVLFQIGMHGKPDPNEYWQMGAKLLMGFFGGWLAWELVNAPLEAVQAILPDFLAELVLISRVLAFALGFVFPDIGENLIRLFAKLNTKLNNGD
jgi:hypothetical protein